VDERAIPEQSMNRLKLHQRAAAFAPYPLFVAVVWLTDRITGVPISQYVAWPLFAVAVAVSFWLGRHFARSSAQSE
jgi:hypothetical protein